MLMYFHFLFRIALLFPENSDLLACSVVMNGKSEKVHRFLVTDQAQLILVEPDNKRMGWAIVRFVGLLQVSF